MSAMTDEDLRRAFEAGRSQDPEIQAELLRRFEESRTPLPRQDTVADLEAS
jgi:hypothetical protein